MNCNHIPYSIIELERHTCPLGTICVAENSGRLPFAVKRVFYITDIPSDSSRGGHSHIAGHEMIVAASGCFDVKIHDGLHEYSVRLDRPWRGLHIPPGIWVSLDNFSTGCICLALCSNTYDDSDYIRSFEEFVSSKRNLTDNDRHTGSTLSVS